MLNRRISALFILCFYLFCFLLRQFVFSTSVFMFRNVVFLNSFGFRVTQFFFMIENMLALRMHLFPLVS